MARGTARQPGFLFYYYYDEDAHRAPGLARSVLVDASVAAALMVAAVVAVTVWDVLTRALW